MTSAAKSSNSETRTSRYSARASASPRKAAASNARSTASHALLRVALIALTVLSAASCKTRQAMATTHASDSLGSYASAQTAVRTTVQLQPPDTATLHLTPLMMQSLPEGAAYTSSSGNATLTAQRTAQGMTLKATAPKTPTMTVEAAAKTDTRQQAATHQQAQAKTAKTTPENTVHQLQWLMLTLQMAILAVILLTQGKKKE